MENANLEVYLNRHKFTQAFKEKVVLEVFIKARIFKKLYKNTICPASIQSKCGLDSFRNNWTME